jgi:hypothetical protein
VCDIAGGPELIESMDGSAGIYHDSASVKRFGAFEKYGW